MIVGLLGADFHSTNRGCGALAYSAVELLRKVSKQKKEKLELYAVLFAAEPSPHISGENEVTIHCIKIEPKKLLFWKECRHIFNQCDIVLDFTGGDSFSDLYGLKRFCIASALKELAIKSNARFIMAPQTIGPFEGSFARLWAKRILRHSDVCFVRDTISAQYMQKTFGVTPLISTDVAFALPYEKSTRKSGELIKIGFNPSGLLWDGTDDFVASKHIVVDYNQYVNKVMEKWCNDSRYEVHLIPHVFTRDCGGRENDMRACVEIQEQFPTAIVEKEYTTPMEAKSVIAAMDVFIGARMHATIASFSCGVATIPFSYSRKFEGLYNDLGYDYLISATSMGTEEAIDKTLRWVENYEELRKKVVQSQKKIEEKQQIFLNELLK